MQWLIGLPIALACVRFGPRHVTIPMLIYAALCVYYGIKVKKPPRRPARVSANFKPGFHTAFSLTLSLILAELFYLDWVKKDTLDRLTGWLHITRSQMFMAISAILFVLVYISVRTIAEAVFTRETEEKVRAIDGQSTAIGGRLHIYLLLCAIAIVTICSKSSPLYPLNDWPDSNCFMTVGKSMLRGVVPYRDLMEQKGPILYAIHALAALISFDSFLGMWLIEIGCCYGFLVYSWKTFRLLRGRASVSTIPIGAALVYACQSFSHGDSVEELCLPILAFAMYAGCRAYINGQLPTAGENLIVGITSACILWMKYTILGFYAGWYIILAARAIKRKEYRGLIRMTALIATGVAITTIAVLAYFLANNAIGDLMEVYFYTNLFAYGVAHSSVPLWGTFVNLCVGIKSIQQFNVWSLIGFGLILWNTSGNKREEWKYVFTTAGFLLLSVYAGGRTYPYYALIFSIYTPLGVMFFIDMIGRALPKMARIARKYGRTTAAAGLCAGILLSFTTTNQYMMLADREAMPQYKFKRDIEVSGISNPTLLNYGFLDSGFYTTTGIVPETKYFCFLNVLADDMKANQDRYIDEGATDFVVTRKKEAPELPNYTLIDSASYSRDGNMYDFQLYQRNN